MAILGKPISPKNRKTQTLVRCHFDRDTDLKLGGCKFLHKGNIPTKFQQNAEEMSLFSSDSCLLLLMRYIVHVKKSIYSYCILSIVNSLKCFHTHSK
jgi:hypothetical protein